jgi:hypothetical protein
MTDPPSYPDTGHDTGVEPDRESTTGIPRWVWMSGIIVAVVVLAVVAVMVIGGRDDGPGPPTPVDREEAGRRYAQCIRDNGVPDFPDPDADGRFSKGEHDPDDPKLRAAQEECRDLAPGGEHQDTGDPASVEQMRQYAQCMRDNGVPDFPDPDADGRLRGPGHEEEGNPKFRAAMEKCRQKLPGGGDHR